MHLEPGTRLDRWIVEAHVASGGMASVYRVRHTSLGSAHALKVLHPEYAPLEARLLGEGRAQSSLRHPNIVAVTDLVSIGSRLGLIMEWVDGPSLDEWLEVARPTPAQLDVIGRGLLSALVVAHAAGWVHRDLKPANVLLQIGSDALVPKISDFGVAKPPAASNPALRTATGRVFGTPAYMAPEQIRDAGRVDARADLFAVGVMLYELAAGERPFEGDDMLEVFGRMSQGPPGSLAERRPDLPARFVEPVDHALVLDRDGRIESAAAMLERWTHDGSPVPLPTSPWASGDLEAARELVPQSPSTVVTGSAWPEPLTPVPSGTDHATGITLQPVSSWSRRAVAFAGVAVGMLLLVVGLSLVGLAASLREAPTTVGPPVVSDDPSVQRRFVLGWEQWVDARLGPAEQTLRAVVHDVPDSPDVYVLLASAHFARGWLEAGLSALSEAEARLRPGTDEALAEVIDAYRGSVGAHGDAAWQVLAEKHPRDLHVQLVACLELVDAPEGEASCRRVRELDDVAILDWARADVALWSGDFDAAAVHVDAFLAKSPGHPRGLAQKSTWHAGRGEWREATRWARQAVRADPQAVTARVALARALAHVGDDTGRREQMELATSDAQVLADRLMAAFEDAQISLGLGQVDRALGRLRSAAVLARESRDWYYVALANSRIGQFGWHLDDVEVLGEGRAGLAEAATAPEVDERIAQTMRVSLLYVQGLEAAILGNLAATIEARDRLESLDVGWDGWLSHGEMVVVLNAYVDRLQGDSRAIAEIAQHWPGCEIDYRGGVWLLERGRTDAGLARLRNTNQSCRAWGHPHHYRRRALALLADRGDVPTD